MWRPLASPAPGLRALALVCALAACAAPAAAAPRLAVAGWPGPEAEATGLVQPALRAPGDSAATAAALARLSSQLQSQGWLDARVRAAWTAGADAALTVTVEPGTRYRWESLSFDGGAADSAGFSPALGWRRGDPASPQALAAGIARAVDAAEAAGHAWASLGVGGWSADSGRVRVRLTGTLGPVVTVQEARLEGLVVTRPEVAIRAMGRLRGLPYNPAAARTATSRLEQLGVFRRVTYLGLAGSGDWQQGVLRWRVEEPRYNQFEGAVGVQGSAGAVGLARLELGNLLGSARAMSLSWQSRGRGLSDFGARYVEPMLFGRALRWEGALQQQIQDTTFTRFRWGMRARVAMGDRSSAEAGLEDERIVQPHADVRDVDAQNTSFALERDGRDEARTPRRGTRVRIEATQVFKHETLRPVAGTPAVVRDGRGSALRFDGEWNRALGRNTGLAWQAIAAGRFSSKRVLDEWERTPLGGAATLRGHDEEAFRVDRFALSRLEWRFFLGPRGDRVALFWDHAQMQTREALAAGGDRLRGESADGLGAGLRLPAAGGDVDLDYGIAPGSGFLDGKIHLRLVTAF
jgi:outer membrane protein assembly factor BamA